MRFRGVAALFPSLILISLLEGSALGMKILVPLDTIVEFQPAPPAAVVVPAEVALTAGERYWAPFCSLRAGTPLVAVVRLDTPAPLM